MDREAQAHFPRRSGQHLDLDHHQADVGELDGVADEIGQHLLQAQRIALQRAQGLHRPVDAQGQPFGLGLGGEEALKLGQQGRQVQGLDLDGQFAGLDARQVQNVVDDPQQALPGHLDAVEHLALVGAEGLAADHLRQAQDGVERGADLVAHVGQERALGPAGLLRQPLRLDQPFLRRLARGDVGEGGQQTPVELDGGDFDMADFAIAPGDATFLGADGALASLRLPNGLLPDSPHLAAIGRVRIDAPVPVPEERHFLPGKTEEALVSVVDQADPVLGIREAQGHRGAAQQMIRPVLAGLRGRLRQGGVADGVGQTRQGQEQGGGGGDAGKLAEEALATPMEGGDRGEYGHGGRQDAAQGARLGCGQWGQAGQGRAGYGQAGKQPAEVQPTPFDIGILGQLDPVKGVREAKGQQTSQEQPPAPRYPKVLNEDQQQAEDDQSQVQADVDGRQHDRRVGFVQGEIDLPGLGEQGEEGKGPASHDQGIEVGAMASPYLALTLAGEVSDAPEHQRVVNQGEMANAPEHQWVVD